MEEPIMEKSEQTEQVGQSVDEPMSSRSNTFYGNDLASQEKVLLEEMESYWEDLSSRLTVSRMVSDSVIRGMVNAVEEASEELASKEAVIAILNQKLQLCEANAAGVDEGCHRSSEASANEQLWEDELERKITGIIFCDFVRSLKDEFERKLEQRSFGEKSSHSFHKRVDELSAISQQLKTVLEFYPSSEFGFLEGLEDSSISKKREQSPWKVLGNHHSTHASRTEENGNESIENSKELREDMHLAFPLLKRMNKEEVIDFFKNEIKNMKMQHDKALQELIEEVFSLKRELLKEKGSTHPIQFRKDKETELVRKNIFNLISKLDDILLEDEKLTSIKYEQESLDNLKEQTDSLLIENQRLRDLIADREKDADSEKQISDYSSPETGYLEQIRKLELENEDIQIESFIRDDTQKILLKELLGELKMDIHGFQMESKMQQDFHSFVHKSILASTISSISTALLNSYEEKNLIKAALLEKENALFSEIEECKKLKQALDSFSKLVREKELLASGMESKVTQQKGQLDLVLREIDILRDKVNERDLYISESKREFNLMVSRLEEALQNARQYEVRLSEANQKLKDISDSVQEAEIQKNLLNAVIAEKQNALVLAAAKEEEHEKWMKSITVFMQEFSKSLVDCESRLVNYLEYIESRFLALKDQFNQLVKQANFVKRKTQWYKELFEISSSNLRKAEIEVDLLGDEVDALTHLLDKVYVALDHYSSVLQHYPGVVDALEMIRTYLKGNSK
ncbi:WPP domain-associated protein-like [Ananas comosus]|uniref:WPP domain-associated protein-like n=1 Tax=Ananas comosus TaxID=4615 RepID=A0A6P5G3W9_ANACO|nr:WPP domain-associated protein-like [Ananas comosus]XP_020103034.1 WPP domain-associated protein-like [Ananas comosus]